jgi:hypothetical protein
MAEVATKLVFNLTDVPTDTLRQHELVNVAVRIGGEVILPGGSRSYRVTDRLATEVAVLKRLGAVSIGEQPQEYLGKKGVVSEVSTASTVTEVPQDPTPVVSVADLEVDDDSDFADAPAGDKPKRWGKRKR